MSCQKSIITYEVAYINMKTLAAFCLLEEFKDLNYSYWEFFHNVFSFCLIYWTERSTKN